MSAVFAAVLTTPDGPFSLIADDHVVFASGWAATWSELLSLVHASVRQSEADIRQVPAAWPDSRLTPLIQAVQDYYDGDLWAPNRIEVCQHSGKFREAAWHVLRSTSPGEVLSYSDLAASTGHPRAIRAAASACAGNAAALFVPCHRVIRADGTLGGFRYGHSVKHHLLNLEENHHLESQAHRSPSLHWSKPEPPHSPNQVLPFHRMCSELTTDSRVTSSRNSR